MEAGFLPFEKQPLSPFLDKQQGTKILQTVKVDGGPGGEARLGPGFQAPLSSAWCIMSVSFPGAQPWGHEDSGSRPAHGLIAAWGPQRVLGRYWAERDLLSCPVMALLIMWLLTGHLTSLNLHSPIYRIRELAGFSLPALICYDSRDSLSAAIL